ncbi:MAG: M56 family metallopeptidase [Planctomycetota bacterium]|jgi:beta-lactamase regulating signal transducer with metallopeptidase domain
MNQAINTCITGLNNIGQGFWNYAVDIFIQSSVLIILLLIIDFVLRKRGRAIFRYCLWMLVFIKLIMPASFTLPTGIGYWMGDYFSSEFSLAKWIPQTEEIVPTTLDTHQGSIPLEPVVTNETAVTDIHQGLIPLEPVMTNETAVTGIELETICWQGFVFLGWLVGMLVLLALLVQRICFVTGLIAQGRPANKRSLDMLDECCCQMGIRQNIELRLSDNTFSPAVCGLFKPMILMPAKILEKLSREKLKTVFIHELAHIKRADIWVSLVQTMLQIVYFYNPLVWLANGMIRRVREQAVDEMVLVTLKPETKNYSNTLIDIAEMAFRRPNFSLRLIGVVESKKALERRIKHILNRPVPKSSKLGSLGLIATIVIGIILLPMGSSSIAGPGNTHKDSREHSETYTIVPGLRVGDYKLGMSKDELLKRLRKTKGDSLREVGNSILADGVILHITDDSVKGITVLRPLYKFANGLGVGDSEQKIKQAFGDNFHLEETQGKDFLTYKDEGLVFEIHKNNRTVMEISVTQRNSREHSETNTIVPGLRVGDYKLGMSKDEVLKRLRKTKGDSLPKAANSISADGIILNFIDDSVNSIDVLSPLYKFANGLGIGDSEQKIKQTFGDDFLLKEFEVKDFLIYENEGLQFEIHKKNRTVMEFTVTKNISRRSGGSSAKEIKSVNEYGDVRWKDLSKLDLSTRKRFIATLTFNQKTVWPEQAKMPPGSDPNKILTDALNPGLGVRELHQQGVTGKGVNVAIIDQPVYLVHPEFAGKIVAYHDTGCETNESSMHGPLVTSLLVGTNCGTAPDARVYYAAAPSWKADAAYYAKGLDWIIAQNEKLPQEEKIRVVSVSASPNQSSWANRQMWDRACARAEADGIMVLDCTDDSHRGFIGRCWYDARYPESVARCNPWAPPNTEFRFNPGGIGILVPSSPRTAAEDGDVPGYQYAGRGGLSRAIPYCAGVLAMGWQVNPELPPEQMRELLYKSAYTKRNGAKIIYPRKFILFVKRTAPRTK